MRSTRPRLALAVLPVLATVACAGQPDASVSESAPPGIPSPARATELLESTEVAPTGSMDGYDRDRFPHWSAAEGKNCNVRERVLIRDGSDVSTGEDCYPTAGEWDSWYDDGTWTDPSDLDIDHVVPLAEAWRSGASAWSTDEREDFANDLDGPQLVAVTDNVNRSKGDDPPHEWMPPDESVHCGYAAAWVRVKHDWELTVTSEERAALLDVLRDC
ncbi:HNH endonuclease family protein [Actinopolyspora mortivallis]|uniref:HNH endonuclease n=1 Tax=Actinopolyspora mortivallis TaxID=33906 RepID=A0A2T0GUI5_ACTMO|nr:HNH endonuclease family protein [Actinopolyspora mortivallis]PRW62757.1 HNH endonuclease [Actinopolyspora mortivallis]